MSPLTILLACFFTTSLVGVAVCGVMGRRWRIRHGRPPGIWVHEPELDGVHARFSSELRRKAGRLARKGRAADDPETAYVTRLFARRTARQNENPWFCWIQPLLYVYMAPFFAVQSVLADTAAMTFVSASFAVLTGALIVGMPIHRTRLLDRAIRAWELNQESAIAYETGSAIGDRTRTERQR